MNTKYPTGAKYTFMSDTSFYTPLSIVLVVVIGLGYQPIGRRVIRIVFDFKYLLHR